VPFKAIGAILLAGFLLGFGAVPFAQMLHDEPPLDYRPLSAHAGSLPSR
jgi:hypothetical protein